MADLIGEEQIDWDTFEVTDAEAREHTPPQDDDAGSGDDGRARDASGRFVATAADDEAAQEQPPAEQERLYAGKYRSVEELEQAVLHQQQLTGRQSSEVGELRAELEALRQTQQQYAPRQDLSSLIDDNPAQAADIAWRAGDEPSLRLALQAWDELSPGAASVWVENKQLGHRLQEIERTTQQQQQSWQQQQQLAVATQAYEQVASRYGDFEQLAPAMSQVAGELASLAGQSVVSQLLESGNPDAVGRALEMLYREAKARSVTPEAAGQEIARQHVQDTLRAKQEAIVASAGGGGPEPPPGETYAGPRGGEWPPAAPRRGGGQGGNY